MFIKNLRYNLILMLRKKTFQFSFLLMLGICIILPFYYATKYRGTAVYLLPSADTLYVGNSACFLWNYISLIFPFLVVFPYSMCFFDESRQETSLYVQTRSGRKCYYCAQVVTCFIGGALIILLPFLLNILLNTIIFPNTGNDYLSTYSRFTENWSNSITGASIVAKVLHKSLLLPYIFINFPQMYNILFAFLAAITSGIMAMLAYAFSLIIRKNRLFIFLPMYLLFEIFSLADSVLYSDWEEDKLYVNLRITNYISNGLPGLGKVYILFYIILSVITITVFFVVRRKIRKDEVS